MSKEEKRTIPNPGQTRSNPNRQGATVKTPKPFPKTKFNQNNK